MEMGRILSNFFFSDNFENLINRWLTVSSMGEEMENETYISSNSSTVHQYDYDDKDYSNYYDEPLYKLQDDVSGLYR